MHQYLSGIQQIGIGVKNAEKAMHTYKHLFGMDVLIFNDEAEARLMTQYTGGKVYNRQAILTMNLQGGGGLEIWQYLDRTPEENNLIAFGDLGIYAAILKSQDITKSHARLSAVKDVKVSEIINCEHSGICFWVTDSCNNKFKIIPTENWFQTGLHDLGGVVGGVIGVSNMEKSLAFYKNCIGLDVVLYDFEYSELNTTYRKVGIRKKATGKGAFNELLGDVTIELVQALNKATKKIYENRYWGDCGFIHLCFDVLDMDSLKSHLEMNNCSLSVDSSNSFEMDNASGRFCYIEDPDGTLIELVETHKVPILKKIGWYLDLRKRNIEKPLPKWMIKLLAISKVK
ncbi:VOC family protein [Flavobacterium algicola]|uniref:VOC family protein n=1 Tax=Flavobacterium algicola TaxID=556529 RepID=UPI001EFE109B|nr:VOC family protein [Flavobacterium algicola]MCG9793863.1 VOC family protein [Flavobacterium algicola]